MADLERAIKERGTAEVLGWGDELGRTLLHFACGGSDPSPETVKMLLELRADPNRGNTNNETPLLYCAIFGTATHREIARCLIDHGADPLLKSKKGMFSFTPLDYARSNGHTEMARLLEEYVASPPAAVQGPGQVWSSRPLCAATCGHAAGRVTVTTRNQAAPVTSTPRPPKRACP